VEVVRAATEGGGDVGGVVLSAGGYIVAHHKINVNSKVTGRVKWIGVEKGDKVKEGQVLVRLEDDEFRAQYDQARGAVENARAYYEELQHGSRPEEVQQAQHNLDEARATAANDKITLDRTRELYGQGVLSKQSLDDATAKYESDQQRKLLAPRVRCCKPRDKPLTPNRCWMPPLSGRRLREPSSSARLKKASCSRRNSRARPRAVPRDRWSR
jgi:multidrug efflux pump subunit AcrA (membrane-fusion protein)